MLSVLAHVNAKSKLGHVFVPFGLASEDSKMALASRFVSCQ